jgi:hypothetical protein
MRSWKDSSLWPILILALPVVFILAVMQGCLVLVAL